MGPLLRLRTLPQGSLVKIPSARGFFPQSLRTRVLGWTDAGSLHPDESSEGSQISHLPTEAACTKVVDFPCASLGWRKKPALPRLFRD